MNNWFEGFHGYIGTNNGLEATNNVIKNQNTERVLHTVSTFLPIMYEIIQDWSIHWKDWAMEPSLTAEIQTQGYILDLKFSTVFEQITDNQWLFLTKLPGKKIDETVVEACRTGVWPSLRVYNFALDFVHKLTVCNGQVTCSCRLGVKRKPCPHSVALTHHEKIRVIPVELQEVPLITRLPGKPSKVASALVINKSPPRPHDDLWREPTVVPVVQESIAPAEEPKRRPGRPRKNEQRPVGNVAVAPVGERKRGPGRPRKDKNQSVKQARSGLRSKNK